MGKKRMPIYGREPIYSTGTLSYFCVFRKIFTGPATPFFLHLSGQIPEKKRGRARENFSENTEVT